MTENNIRSEAVRPGSETIAMGYLTQFPFILELIQLVIYAKNLKVFCHPCQKSYSVWDCEFEFNTTDDAEVVGFIAKHGKCKWSPLMVVPAEFVVPLGLHAGRVTHLSKVWLFALPDSVTLQLTPDKRLCDEE